MGLAAATLLACCLVAAFPVDDAPAARQHAKSVAARKTRRERVVAVMSRMFRQAAGPFNRPFDGGQDQDQSPIKRRTGGVETALCPGAGPIIRPVLPARRYRARFFLSLALGALAGLLVGELVEAPTGVPGWGVFGAAAGFVLGLLVFMLRRDT